MQPEEESHGITRRAVVAGGLVAGGAAAVAAVTGWRRWGDDLPPGGLGRPEVDVPTTVAHRTGRLSVRPRPAEGPAPAPGLHPLGLSSGRDGLLFVPAGYGDGGSFPLVVMLHGAGGNAEGGLAPFLDLADEAGLLLAAPESRGKTWDVIEDDYGRDVAFVDRMLEHLFVVVGVDPSHLAIEGFSDGASYALSLGLTNGDLFTHCIAFSPGFQAAASRRGRLPVFVSHGVADNVLPIDRCSRRIVPALRRDGYEVEYREFDGGHAVPSEQAQAALDWLAKS